MNDIVTQPKPMYRTPLRPALPPRAYAKPLRKPERTNRIPQWLQVLLGVPVIMFASLFIQSAALGQAAVVAYGIAAFVWHIPSRTTFSLALLSLIATTLLLVVRGNLALSQNFAIYTFLLLVVGVITLSFELKKEGGRIYSNRRSK